MGVSEYSTHNSRILTYRKDTKIRYSYEGSRVQGLGWFRSVVRFLTLNLGVMLLDLPPRTLGPYRNHVICA